MVGHGPLGALGRWKHADPRTWDAKPGKMWILEDFGDILVEKGHAPTTKKDKKEAMPCDACEFVRDFASPCGRIFFRL